MLNYTERSLLKIPALMSRWELEWKERLKASFFDENWTVIGHFSDAAFVGREKLLLNCVLKHTRYMFKSSHTFH